MGRFGVLLIVVAGGLWGVGDWVGDARLTLPSGRAAIRAERVALDPADPGRRRVGALTYLGGVRLSSPDPAFGGFSALAVHGREVTLLNDGGTVARFGIDHRGRISRPALFPLPAGPQTGWRKEDRDSESLAVSPATGQVWVGFERANAIWRYSRGFARAEGSLRPSAMRGWKRNGGAEAMVRLSDGRFLVIAEQRTGGPGREALLFPGDPLSGRAPLRFRYMPPAGFDPSDATQLPDGRILVLNRWWGLPLRFESALVLIDPTQLRPGVQVRGREIARLAQPLLHENFEGVAAAVEAGRSVVWLVSDNDQYGWRPTLLLKFRLD